MKKRIISKFIKLNNRGAAIVTVIVVSALISILATTLLYISARNFQSKQTDYQNKISFYRAEDCLESLKALLIEDVSDAFSYAYVDTMSNYVHYYGSINVSNYYAKSYTDRLKAIWEDRRDASKLSGDTDSEAATKAIKNYMRDKLIKPSMTQDEKDEIEAMINCIVEVQGFIIPPEKDKFLIQGVKVNYTSSNNYSTYICTDLGLELPKYDTTELNKDWGSTTGEEYTSVDITGCVKYTNWKRYD